jgi:hypothetical protein
MPNQHGEDIGSVIMRLMRERLDSYEIPSATLQELKNEILKAVGTPERTKFGACVMTPQASMAADQQRKGNTVPPGSAKPDVV